MLLVNHSAKRLMTKDKEGCLMWLFFILHFWVTMYKKAPYINAFIMSLHFLSHNIDGHIQIYKLKKNEKKKKHHCSFH